jgi:alkylated DNA repair dioxygenase AlkB
MLRAEKLSVDLYTDAVTQQQESELYWQSVNYLSNIYGEQLNSRRRNFTIGDPGLVYSVTFGGYQDKPARTVDREAIPWETIPAIVGVRDWFAQQLNKQLTCCIVQYYPSGKFGIQPHRDREISQRSSAAAGTVIAGLSLGATRTLQLTPPRFINSPSYTLELTSRSLYVLHPPTNDYWMHSITTDPAISHPRLSLTFRDL